jgi:hypothetical protein
MMIPAEHRENHCRRVWQFFELQLVVRFQKMKRMRSGRILWSVAVMNPEQMVTLPAIGHILLVALNRSLC